MGYFMTDPGSCCCSFDDEVHNEGHLLNIRSSGIFALQIGVTLKRIEYALYDANTRTNPFLSKKLQR